MAGPITSNNIPKALWPGVDEWFGMEYTQHEPEYPELFDHETSEKKYEEDVQTVGMGLAPVKAEGQPTFYDSIQQGGIQRYTHVAYSLGFIVTHEEIEDNLYMKLGKQRSEALAFSMHQTKEIVGSSVYNNAFTGSFTGWDGVSLISNAHPTVSGNQSNTLAVASQLSEASLEALQIQIGLAQDDRGLKIAIRPECLIIPINLLPDAYRILNSTLQNDTANNAVNYLKATNAFPEGIHINHYLTATHTYFVRTNCPNGMKYFEREALSFTQDNDFDTENAKFKAYERYSFGWTDWRALYAVSAP